MKKSDKIKLALLLCSEMHCDECVYNRWVKDVCKKHLFKDALKLINELEQPQKPDLEQLTFNI